MVRDETGRVCRIVEEKDASAEERAIREINSGIYVRPGRAHRDWIGALKNDNAQGEYYLTDIVAMAAAGGVVVETVTATQAEEEVLASTTASIGSPRTCPAGSACGSLMRAGTTLADPARVDVRGMIDAGRIACSISTVCSRVTCVSAPASASPHTA